MPLAYMNAYPPTINWRAASLTCRSRCSDGAATFTAQMSKPAMNIAISTTGSISQRCGYATGDPALFPPARRGTGLDCADRDDSSRRAACRDDSSRVAACRDDSSWGAACRDWAFSTGSPRCSMLIEDSTVVERTTSIELIATVGYARQRDR